MKTHRLYMVANEDWGACEIPVRWLAQSSVVVCPQTVDLHPGSTMNMLRFEHIGGAHIPSSFIFFDHTTFKILHSFYNHDLLLRESFLMLS